MAHRPSVPHPRAQRQSQVAQITRIGQPPSSLAHRSGSAQGSQRRHRSCADPGQRRAHRPKQEVSAPGLSTPTLHGQYPCIPPSDSAMPSALAALRQGFLMFIQSAPAAVHITRCFLASPAAFWLFGLFGQCRSPCGGGVGLDRDRCLGGPGGVGEDVWSGCGPCRGGMAAGGPCRVDRRGRLPLRASGPGFHCPPRKTRSLTKRPPARLMLRSPRAARAATPA